MSEELKNKVSVSLFLIKAVVAECGGSEELGACGIVPIRLC